MMKPVPQVPVGATKPFNAVAGQIGSPATFRSVSAGSTAGSPLGERLEGALLAFALHAFCARVACVIPDEGNPPPVGAACTTDKDFAVVRRAVAARLDARQLPITLDRGAFCACRRCADNSPNKDRRKCSTSRQ